MWTFLFFIIIVFAILSVLNKSEAIGNWSHLFPDMQHDPEEFYKLVEEVLQERKVPDVRTGRRTFKQGGFFSNQRIYLAVFRGDYIFHICAAPWGTGFFFSSWVRKSENNIEDLLVKLPFIGKIIAKAIQYETYYKLDTDAMFRTSVHQSILAAIDRLTETKGIRGLTELERKPDLRTSFN